MYARFKILGIGLAIAGLAFVGVGGYTFMRTQDGAKALNSFSTAQAVKLTYTDQGQITDSGKADEGAAIMGMLTNDWGYAVNSSEMNPNDPLVNTASEYMYQMATIAYHTLHSTQTVVLPEAVTAADGTVYAAGSYDFAVEGRYWSQFNRANPIEAAARAQAWTGTAHALIAELGVGSVTASTIQMGLGIAAIAAALGAVLLLTGLGVIWAARPVTETSRATVKLGAATPVGI